MIVQFSVVPVGTGESLSEFVSHIIKIVKDSGLPYNLTAMGTIVEGEWDDIMALVKECRTKALKETGRVLINMTMDIRPDKPMDRISEKVRSVEKKLDRPLSE